MSEPERAEQLEQAWACLRRGEAGKAREMLVGMTASYPPPPLPRREGGTATSPPGPLTGDLRSLSGEGEKAPNPPAPFPAGEGGARQGPRATASGDGHRADDLQASDLRLLNLLGEANRHIAQEGREVERCELILCGNVGTYRRHAREVPRADDVVIELGCADGQTTRYLARRAALVVAVDAAPQVIAAARVRNLGCDNVHFIAADADEVGRVAAVIGAADLLFVDVGGSSPPWIGYKLAKQYRDMFLPRAVILRSKELNDFVRAVMSVDEEAKPAAWTSPVPPLWKR